ncbi:serine hydroxymethyltransferase [Candidatus Desulfarcum epimagneticum]|uniref:Serine hydroxymethyltransferase n=1 Tax=uncultured Desulfobacteraceae bacterium TaxID=218296 RepID=A0A484HLA4_9BACT|nr:serine hydroxymethyltransferase [uncultured Desulfobacteraceae bacterium]
MDGKNILNILDTVKKADKEIAAAIEKEMDRQRHTLELIASENIVSRTIMAIQGSVLTNKYAEGYPGKRYYGGCEYVDVAEDLAIERARALFGADYANVQPHSGSQANMGIYFALLKPGDTVLGMDLSHGGHLTHGSPVSFSGKLYKSVSYGLSRDTGLIDYDELARLAEAHKPAMIIAGASAYPRIIDFERFAEIARSAGAYLMVDMAHIAGLVAAGVHPSPIPHADVVSSTTHKTLRGPRGGLILSRKDLSARLGREIFPGIQGGPLMHVIAAKAAAFKEADSDAFRAYQRDVVENAKAMARRLADEKLTLVSGGTDNHMILVDLRSLNITGNRAQDVLGRAGITVNKNAVPFEEQKAHVTSGIRIGTPAITTRGMKTPQVEAIADMIADILKDPENDALIESVREKTREMCAGFPLDID